MIVIKDGSSELGSQLLEASWLHCSQQISVVFYMRGLGYPKALKYAPGLGLTKTFCISPSIGQNVRCCAEFI